jgi:serine/threonine protein kinase
MGTPEPIANGEPQGAEATAELLVLEYLELLEKEGEPDLERFAARLPEGLRQEFRERVETVRRVRPLLKRVPGAVPSPEDEPPAIPGFRIERFIGQGGLGTVYAAWDEALERRVALKVLRRGTPGEARARILKEARRAAGLAHPAIVTIHSVVEAADTPAIVMEYVEGQPIDRAAGSLGPKKKARLLQKVARALAAAHQRGVIHRDLKPDNVLVTARLEPKILDFGLAISPGRGPVPGLFEGTPLYASPEQARGEPLEPSSDVFSLGALMYTVLAGSPPFEGKTLAEVLEKVKGAAPPFPRAVAPQVPEDLQAICLACLAKDPKERPAAREVAADLARYLAGEPARLRPSLYGDILRRRISEHLGDLKSWRSQGMISHLEGDRLQLVYRRILADEDHWIIDARKLSLPQTVLYTGTWMAVVAAVLLVWLARADLAPAARWLLPAAAGGCLLLVGGWAHRKREVLAAASCLAGAIFCAVPAVLSALAEEGVLSARPSGVGQLLGPPFSNHQLLASSLVGLALSLIAWRYFRLTGFAWTTAALAVGSYLSLLLTRGWLDLEPEWKALWCLPLVGLEPAALLCERWRRVRWALPFHLVALIVFVAALDVMAQSGPTLAMMGFGPAAGPPGAAQGFLDHNRQVCWSLALNGVVILLVMVGIERAPSLDLRRGGRILEVLAPIHVLGSLYASAEHHSRGPGAPIDVGLYLGAVFLFLLLGPWRSRQRFLLAGLIGIGLGSHLLIDCQLVRKLPFLIGLGAAGLLAALGTFIHLLRKSEAGGPERP